MATTPKPTILKTPNTPGKPGEPNLRNAEAATPPAKAGGLLRWILIGSGAVILLVGLVVGGWLWKRHHGHSKASTAAKVVVKESKPATPPATVEMPLEPFVVNLADAGGHSYARIGLTLSLLAPADAKKSEEKKDTAVSGPDLKDEALDTIITVLSEQQSSDLLAVGGKDHLKQLLRQAMAARDPRLQVTDIYFTEFLVQS